MQNKDTKHVPTKRHCPVCDDDYTVSPFVAGVMILRDGNAKNINVCSVECKADFAAIHENLNIGIGDDIVPRDFIATRKRESVVAPTNSNHPTTDGTEYASVDVGSVRVVDGREGGETIETL